MKMSTTELVTREKLNRFQRELRSTGEPDQTVFGVIGRSTRERDWQQLLAYFLRPANRHGLGTDVLSTFLQTIVGGTDISGLSGSLDTIRVDVEVQTTSKKRVDLLLSQDGEWFLCVELKVTSEEHTGQTAAYVETEYIGTRQKANYPTNGHHYLYVAPDTDNRPDADAFEHITWTELEQAWHVLLESYLSEDSQYPTRGTAQFAEFLAMVRAEAGAPRTGMDAYYRDVESAERTYNDLANSLATAIEAGIRERTEGNDPLRVRRRQGNFPQFTHGKYNRIEIDKPGWTAGRSKATVLYEVNYHLRPHLGPGETQHRPSVALNLDIRGGTKLKQELREAFGERVDAEEYRVHGFGEPHTNSKWHFLTKEVLLDETATPVADILEAFDVLYGFEPVLDDITRQV